MFLFVLVFVVWVFATVCVLREMVRDGMVRDVLNWRADPVRAVVCVVAFPLNVVVWPLGYVFRGVLWLVRRGV